MAAFLARVMIVFFLESKSLHPFCVLCCRGLYSSVDIPPVQFVISQYRITRGPLTVQCFLLLNHVQQTPRNGKVVPKRTVCTGNRKNENVKTNKIQHLNSLLISRFYDRLNGAIITELSQILNEM